MNNDNVLRELFEASFAVPAGIQWIESEGDYSIDDDVTILVASNFASKWEAFREAFRAALEIYRLNRMSQNKKGSETKPNPVLIDNCGQIEIWLCTLVNGAWKPISGTSGVMAPIAWKLAIDIRKRLNR